MVNAPHEGDETAQEVASQRRGSGAEMALVVHSTDAVRPHDPRPALRAVLDNPLVGDFPERLTRIWDYDEGGRSDYDLR
jgi:hypothetical protein